MHAPLMRAEVDTAAGKSDNYFCGETTVVFAGTIVSCAFFGLFVCGIQFSSETSIDCGIHCLLFV